MTKEAEPNIFISWSGSRSKHVAVKLQRWLHTVLQRAIPWMSDRDIDAGAPWDPVITELLQKLDVGIVCLTPENVGSPYIHFEAGALSKVQSETSALCVYLLGGLTPSNVGYPLARFQFCEADRDGTLRILQSINKRFAPPLDHNSLMESFDLHWPEFERALSEMPSAGEPPKPKRDLDSVLDELLQLARERNNGAAPIGSLQSPIRWPSWEKRAPFTGMAWALDTEDDESDYPDDVGYPYIAWVPAEEKAGPVLGFLSVPKVPDGRYRTFLFNNARTILVKDGKWEVEGSEVIGGDGHPRYFQL